MRLSPPRSRLFLFALLVLVPACTLFGASMLEEISGSAPPLADSGVSDAPREVLPDGPSDASVSDGAREVGFCDRPDVGATQEFCFDFESPGAVLCTPYVGGGGGGTIGRIDDDAAPSPTHAFQVITPADAGYIKVYSACLVDAAGLRTVEYEYMARIAGLKAANLLLLELLHGAAEPDRVIITFDHTSSSAPVLRELCSATKTCAADQVINAVNTSFNPLLPDGGSTGWFRLKVRVTFSGTETRFSLWVADKQWVNALVLKDPGPYTGVRFGAGFHFSGTKGGLLEVDNFYAATTTGDASIGD